MTAEPPLDAGAAHVKVTCAWLVFALTCATNVGAPRQESGGTGNARNDSYVARSSDFAYSPPLNASAKFAVQHQPLPEPEKILQTKTAAVKVKRDESTPALLTCVPLEGMCSPRTDPFPIFGVFRCEDLLRQSFFRLVPFLQFLFV